MHLYTSIPVDVLVFTEVSNLDRDRIHLYLGEFGTLTLTRTRSCLLRIHHDVGRRELIIPLIGLHGPIIQLYHAKLPSIQLAAHIDRKSVV